MYAGYTHRRGSRSIGGRYPSVPLGPSDRMQFPSGLSGLDGFGSFFNHLTHGIMLGRMLGRVGRGVLQIGTMGMYDVKKNRFYAPFSGGQIRNWMQGYVNVGSYGLVNSDKFFNSRSMRLVGNIGAGVEAAAAVAAGGYMAAPLLAGPGFGAAAAGGAGAIEGGAGSIVGGGGAAIAGEGAAEVVGGGAAATESGGAALETAGGATVKYSGAMGMTVPEGLPGGGMTIGQMAESGQFTQTEIGRAITSATQESLSTAQEAAGIVSSSSSWLPSVAQLGKGTLETLNIGNQLLGTYGQLAALQNRGGGAGGQNVMMLAGPNGMPQGYMMSPTGMLTPVGGPSYGGDMGGGYGGGPAPGSMADDIQQATGVSPQTAQSIVSWLPYVVIGAGILGVVLFTGKKSRK